MSKKDIAIIGMSGKFSGSRNIREFWKNIRAGKELVHFYSEEELLDKGMDSALLKDDTYIKIGSRIDNKNSFDAAFFGYTKEEAGLMDPQIRLFHEHTWKALDDAGYNP
jgi:acyl transferase domain-containing protein